MPEPILLRNSYRENYGKNFRTFFPSSIIIIENIYRIVRIISHPNIITVYDVLELNDVIYMFMDYCRNGDLLEYIRNNGPLSEDRAKCYFKYLASHLFLQSCD